MIYYIIMVFSKINEDIEYKENKKKRNKGPHQKT